MENLHILHTVVLELSLCVVGCGEIIIIFLSENSYGEKWPFSLFKSPSFMLTFFTSLWVCIYLVMYYLSHSILSLKHFNDMVAGLSIFYWFLIHPLAYIYLVQVGLYTSFTIGF